MANTFLEKVMDMEYLLKDVSGVFWHRWSRDTCIPPRPLQTRVDCPVPLVYGINCLSSGPVLPQAAIFNHHGLSFMVDADMKVITCITNAVQHMGHFSLFGLGFMMNEDMKVITCITNDVQHTEHLSLSGLGFMVDEDMKVIACITNDVQHMDTLVYLGLVLWWTRI